MKICQLIGKAVHKSLQQPSSRAAQQVQQNCPPPPAATADKTRPIQLNGINPQHCTGTKTTTSVKSGIKRNVDQENEDVTFHVSKCSTSQDESAHIQACTAGGSQPAQLPCSSSQYQNCISPRVRIKKTPDGDYNFRERSGHKSKRVRQTYRAQGSSSNNFTHTFNNQADGRNSSCLQLPQFTSH